MTERYAYQMPPDTSAWERVDLAEEDPAEVIDFSEASEGAAEKPEGVGGILDADSLAKLAEMEDPPLSEDEELKQALLEQHHRDHFEVPDPSDDLTDDELFERMPKPWRNQ